MKTAIRWGLFYVTLTFLLVGLGLFNQEQQSQVRALEKQKVALELQQNQLKLQQLKTTSPHNLYQWAEKTGFVPLAQGNWGDAQ